MSAKLSRVNYGRRLEDDVQKSCKEQNIFFHNIRDVFLPPDVRRRVRLPQQSYDCIMFHNKVLFPMELKTTKNKSISFAEAIIKQHQIDNLLEASKFENVIAGFLFNFREQPNNHTFFIPIERFVEYQNIAQNQLEHTYVSRVNQQSIPIDICREIGYEVKAELKQVNYRYYMSDLLDTVLIHRGY